ncbi:MAG TPA: tetratricopeptide repeat protein [Kofleriaceae bacterium]|nr:tetratricopeptide repeat protein [Kofleriaceae bacterium]
MPAALGAELADEDVEEVVEGPPAYPITTRFVGRKPLIDRLIGVLETVQHRNELAFVALTGPPGVGKSRLARELGRVIQEKLPETRVMSTVAGGPGAPPYAAFQRILRDRFGLGEADEGLPPHAARERILSQVAELLPASRATEVAHLLGQLVDFPFPDSPVVEPLAETPTQLEARTFIAVRRFLAADAARQPLILILDDIARASPETVNLIHYLAAGLASSPVALLVVGRPSLFEVHATFGDGDVTLERVEMGPLSEDESSELFTELARPAGDAPPELLRHARDRMGGAPRALVELVRYLLEVGAIVDATGTGKWAFDSERLKETALPDTLEAVLTARLRVMDAGERNLLEKAAACGEAFWLDALVALVRAAALERGDPDGPTLGEIAGAGDRTRHEVEGALKTLERRGLLLEQPHSSIPGEREYRFAYPPWWDVVYEGIDVDARRRYHRLIAQWLELRPEGRGEESQEDIGRHLERAGDGEGAALRYRRAADAARVRFFNEKATRLYAAALGCLGQHDLASRIHLWHDLGSVFQLKGDHDSALGAFERMLRLAWVVASRTKAAVAFNKMGRIYRQKGDLPIALEYLERGLELFQQADDTRGVAGSLDDIGQVLWLLSRYDEALDRSAAALETRRRLGDKRSIATSLLNIGHIERHRGLFDEAEACYREALAIRQALNDRAGIGAVQNGLGVLAFQRGDTEGARREWEAALELSEAIGALPLQATLLNHLGEAARMLGHRGEARTRFEAAEALARDLDDRRLLSEALRNIGLLDLAAGDSEHALDRCNQALDIASAAGIRVDVGRALLALGEVNATTLFDDTGAAAHRAEDFFRRGVDLFREIGNDAELALGLERFGKYRIERGETDDGRALLTEAQEIFTRLGMKSDALRRVMGEL